jgi:hypothetical protein
MAMNPIVRNAFDNLIKDPKVRKEMLESIEFVNRAASSPNTIARADSGSSVDPSAPNPVADNTAANASTPDTMTVAPEVITAITAALVASPDFVKAVTDICTKVCTDMMAVDDSADASGADNGSPVMNSIDITNAITAAMKPLSDKLESIERGLLSADEAAILEAAGSAKNVIGRDAITRAKKTDPAASTSPASLADRAAAQISRMTPVAK